MRKKLFKNRAIVIGGNHLNTLGVVRSLGEMGVPVYLILTSKKGGYVNKSRYVTQSWEVNCLEDDVINILISNFISDRYKPVIIPTSDFAMKVIDCNYNMLRQKYIVPNAGCTEGKVVELMNKSIMNKIAVEAGFNIPESWELDFDSTGIFIPKEIVYPCIVKPLCSIEGKKSDINICQNRSELKNSLLRLKDDYNRVLVQEYIYGKNDRMLEVIGCITLNKGMAIMPGVIKKIREYPLNAGSTSYAVVTKDCEYIDKGSISNLMKRICFRGIFDMEFKYANGKIYFIEVNFRNGAPGYVLTKMGINLPYLWYLEAIGVNIDNFKKVINQKHYFMVETSDIRHVLNGDLSLIAWVKNLLKINAFLFVSFKDLKPVLIRLFKK